MKRQLKRVGFVVATFAVALGVLMTIEARKDKPRAEPVREGESRLVRGDSHVLGETSDAGVTFVEFLDFECEGCRAAYPIVEQLREEYDGRVTFVARYFPMPDHFNGMSAARAVEAAAQQGKFEEMYHLMYETQGEWGEQRTPADDVFRGFAERLELDLDRFQEAYDDPATEKRIEKDIADGHELGVQGTPTFFVNGERLEPTSPDDLGDALDEALEDAGDDSAS